VEGNLGADSGASAAAFMNLLMALGVPAEGLGWTRFFLLCGLAAIPGMVLLFWVAPLSRREPKAST
jgi:hypothetical protein